MQPEPHFLLAPFFNEVLVWVRRGRAERLSIASYDFVLQSLQSLLSLAFAPLIKHYKYKSYSFGHHGWRLATMGGGAKDEQGFQISYRIFQR